MNLSLIQLLSLVSYFGLSAAILTSPLIQTRGDLSGWSMVLLAVFLFLLRYTFHPPSIRSHVPNEAMLRPLSHVIGFGVPATMALFGGVGFLTWSVGIAALVSSIALGIHVFLCVKIPR